MGGWVGGWLRRQSFLSHPIDVSSFSTHQTHPPNVHSTSFTPSFLPLPTHPPTHRSYLGWQNKDANVEIVFFEHAQVVDFPRAVGGWLDVRVHGRDHAQVVELDLGCVWVGGWVDGWERKKGREWDIRDQSSISLCSCSSSRLTHTDEKRRESSPTHPSTHPRLPTWSSILCMGTTSFIDMSNCFLFPPPPPLPPPAPPGGLVPSSLAFPLPLLPLLVDCWASFARFTTVRIVWMRLYTCR